MLTLNKLHIFFLCFCTFALSSFYATAQIYSIVTNPSENTATAMRVSWAADTTVKESYVLYTLKSDKTWKRAGMTIPQQSLCTVFDSIYSKNASGENFYENAVFYKCGAELTNLRPDTEYKYLVLSEIVSDYSLISDSTEDVHYFKTSGAKSWSALIISDFHCYPPLPKRLEAADAMMDQVKKYDPKIDWVLHLGDVCAWGGSYSFWKYLYENKYFKEYMWAGVNGNHDNMTRKYQLTNDFFRNANFNPENGYEPEVGVCYYFKYGSLLFIMLNNESMRSDEGLAAAQNWLRSVVRENPSKSVVVCEHYQWFFGEDGKESQYARWKDVFEECGVDLALAGNNHIYVRAESDGTEYIQTPSSDNERGMEMKDTIGFNQDKIKFRWTEGPKTVGAMHINVTPSRMILTLLDREGSVIDKKTLHLDK